MRTLQRAVERQLTSVESLEPRMLLSVTIDSIAFSSGVLTVTDNQSGFGSGPNIIIFENFERGTSGNAIDTDAPVGDWSGTSSTPTFIADGSNMAGLLVDGTASRGLRLDFTGTTEFFLSYKTKIPEGYHFPNTTTHGDFAPDSAWKQAWIFDDSTYYGYTGDDDVCLPTWGNGTYFSLGGNDNQFEKNGETYHPVVGRPGTSTNWYSFDEWNQASMWFKAGSNPRQDNGTLYFSGLSASTGLKEFNDSFIMFDGDDGDQDNDVDQWTHLNLSGWHRTGGVNSAYDSTTRGIYDDIYMATGSNAAARVIIADNGDFTQITKMAIQTPTSWSAGSISATLQEGEFEPGELAYVFVVDADNNFSEPTAFVIPGASPTLPTVAVGASDAAAAESPADNGQFIVARDDTSGNLTVNYTVSGTATSGTDYAALSGSVTIPDGQTSATINVTPINDGNIENDETVVVTLSSSASYNLESQTSDTVTIASEDLPTVTITANDDSAAENPLDSGQFTVTRSGSGLLTNDDLVVNYTVGGTADSADYTQTLSGSVTIPQGQTSVTIDITPVNDTTPEAPETVTLTISSASTYSIGASGSDSVTIDSEDLTSVFVDFGNPKGWYSSPATDDSGRKWNVLGTATTSPGTIAADLVDQVGVNTGIDLVLTASGFDSEGNYGATSSSLTDWDYEVMADNFWHNNATPTIEIQDLTVNAEYELVFYAAGLGTNQGLAVTVGGESEDELFGATETELLFTFDVTADANGVIEFDLPKPTGASYARISGMQITESALPEVTIAANDDSAAESPQNAGQFTVTRSNTDGNLTVYYTVSGTASSSDYSETLSGSVTISDGNSTATIDITPVDDSYVEDNETVTLTLSSNAAYTLGATTSDSVTITSDDTSSETTLAATADASPRGGWGDDYAGGTGQYLYVRGGTGSSDRRVIMQFSLANIGDTINSAQFGIYSSDINDPTSTVTLTAYRVTQQDWIETEVTYNDRNFGADGVDGGGDDAPWTTPGIDYDNTEYATAQLIGNGGNGSFTPVTFDVTDLVQTALDAQQTTVSFLILSDTDEDHALCSREETMYHGEKPYLTITEGFATVTIAANDASAAENPADNGQFTVTRDTTDGNLTVNYTVSGTATSGSDYTALSGSVTIADGQSTATINVVPIDDSAIEDDETVVVTLSSDAAYTLGATTSDTVTISSEDLPTVTIAANDDSAAESPANTGQFTVTRDNTDGNLVVNYSVSGTASSSDYSETLSGSVTISDGQSTATINITPVNDSYVEDSETLTLTLSSNASYTLGATTSDTVTIASEDVPTETNLAATADAAPYGGWGDDYTTGSSQYLYVRGGTGSSDRRIIMQFSLANIGDTIDSAEFGIYSTDINDPTSTVTLTAYRVTQNDWVESEVTYNDRHHGADGVDGGGDDAPWTTPGVDYDNSEYATAQLIGNGGSGSFTPIIFNVTDLVQSALDAQQSSVSFLIVSDTDENHALCARDETMYHGEKPYLTIDHYDAEPEAMMLASSPADSDTVEKIEKDDIARRLEQTAMHAWRKAGYDVKSLRDVQIVVADLGGNVLAQTSGNTIYIDDDAAGAGWFIDATPRRNEEFAVAADGLAALDGSEADGDVDLLTLLTHEFGHVLGVDHSDAAGSVMNDTLNIGTRLEVVAADNILDELTPVL